MGYEVDNLDNLQAQADRFEADLMTLEEIADMMEEAMTMMDSALETAKLEKDIVMQAGDKAAEAQQVAAQEFERSPQMRLWRASGMAACAVFKAMILGGQRGKDYVTEQQVYQATNDIVERLSESDSVKQRLAQRLDQLRLREAELQETLDRADREKEVKQTEVEELQNTLDDPETDVLSGLKETLPDEESRKRIAGNRLRDVELEWREVDDAAKKKFETIEAAIQVPPRPGTWFVLAR
jgi:hypothetical protein